MAPSGRQRYAIPSRIVQVRHVDGSDRRTRDRLVQTVKIRWHNTGPNEDTWEPVEHFADADFHHLFEAFGLQRVSGSAHDWIRSPELDKVDCMVAITVPAMRDVLSRSNIAVQVSSIHGYGVKTLRRFSPGVVIFTLTGMLRVDREPPDSAFWSFSVPVRVTGSRRDRHNVLYFTPTLCCPINYVNSAGRNHAANCFVRYNDTVGTLHLETILPIRKGAELLIEYPAGFSYSVQPSRYSEAVVQALLHDIVR